ncbi:MAG: 3-deoxy-manno-octulosonate cytidylyltransferase [Nitrospirae bacterium]|nr:3-deoxy-manno-octulosonate cytidylyltransferase [Nitrospirota bacterium]
MPRAVAIIPARFSSTRFPGKPLAILKGKPLIQHVYENAVCAKLIDAVIVATDDNRIFDAVTGFGGKAVMTSPEHFSGTDRIAEAARGIDCDIIVNIQGDEPFIKPEMVDDAVKLLYDDSRASISTLVKKITDIGEIFSKNIVKVVFDNEGFAMYFSRAPIPFYRDEWKSLKDLVSSDKSQVSSKRKNACNLHLASCNFFKHIGIYGYRKGALLKFTSLPQDRLELIEQLEQLRALASGIKIKVKETSYNTLGIDTIEDLRKAEEWLNLSL